MSNTLSFRDSAHAFVDLLQETDAAWDENVTPLIKEWPVEPAQPGSRAAYDAMASHVYDVVVKKGQEANFHPKILKHTVRKGLIVAARYGFTGGKVAKREGLSYSELTLALQNPDTYIDLGAIADNEQPISVDVEDSYGLRSSQDWGVEMALPNFTFKDGALRLRGIKGQIETAEVHFIEEDSNRVIDPTKGCIAHKIGILEPVYNNVMSITTKDSRLLRATYDQSQQDTRAS